MVVSKRLDHGSSHPTKPLRALAGTPTARDDTVLWLGGLFWAASTINMSPRHHLATNVSFPPSNILRILSILSSAFYFFFSSITTQPHHEGNLYTIPPSCNSKQKSGNSTLTYLK